MGGFVFEKLTQELGVNESWPLGIAGNEVVLVGSSYPVAVELRKDNRVIGVASGVMAGDYIRGMDFDYFRVINGSAAQSVTVLVSSGSSGSNRVVGEVSVISGEVTRSKNELAFVVSGYSSAVAAQYSYVELWNPAASGKRLVVTQILTHGNVEGVAGIYSATVASGSLFAQEPKNKKLGGAGSVGKIYVGSSATEMGALFVAMTTAVGSTSSSFLLPMNEPMVLPEGYGLVVAMAAVNEQTRASFQFWEDSI